MDTHITRWSVDHPKLVTLGMLVLMVVLAAFIPKVKVDTDPENMLHESEAVRVFHRRMKAAFELYDIVVLGVVNEEDPNGVFNPRSLKKIHALTEYARTLSGEKLGLDKDHALTESGRPRGVIEKDLLSLSTVDNIEPGGLGSVKFEWLMKQPPETVEEALAIREKARRLHFLDGTLISEDGRAVCLYLPLTEKHLSNAVYQKLKGKIAELGGPEQYHITGLPVAEDVFGVQMFKQMAISAPTAMFIIFVLLWVFFRKLSLIASPMILAMVSVICTMGLLIGTGNTVHIMSSMIPIFIMPIAVLDSTHILSEFFDRYQATKDRRKTIRAVMDELFVPMLYTSLTSAAGFASLALTPIPPVQTFGVFVAFGVMLAWVLTVTFIPAYVMFLNPKSLENFGSRHHEGDEHHTALARGLSWMGGATYKFAALVVAVAVVVAVVAGYGISRIQINDNPIKWFNTGHPIRVADKVLNAHFGGTYMGYLALQAPEGEADSGSAAADLSQWFTARGEALKKDYPGAPKAFAQLAAEAKKDFTTLVAKREALKTFVAKQLAKKDLPADEQDAWYEAETALAAEKQRDQLFKDPAVLRYIATLQDALLKTEVVGKSNSITDVVKTVHRELFEGKEDHYSVPDTPAAVAQCLITYQGSHRPDDLWHFIEKPDEATGKTGYRMASLWVQLTSGDNMKMERVVKSIDAFIAQNPPPHGITHHWFGLTYINVVWQDKMVKGMMQAFLGSFLVVFLMMTVLFRSALWGLLSMIPLTLTIAFIYGLIGLIGKDYDMPVAVLSSLSLGLAVDFAIHFLARSRSIYRKTGSWAKSTGEVFGEPARAISRNVIIIAVGFLPLLAAPLRPYKTVGFFIATILAVSGVGTLFLLPALIRLMEKLLFPRGTLMPLACMCGTCLVSAVALVALVAVNVQQFFALGWNEVSIASGIAIPILAAVCWATSHREQCRILTKEVSDDAPE